MSAIYREFPLRAPSAWTALVAFIKANAQACLDRGHTLRVIVTEDEKKRGHLAAQRLRDDVREAWKKRREM